MRLMSNFLLHSDSFHAADVRLFVAQRQFSSTVYGSLQSRPPSLLTSASQLACDVQCKSSKPRPFCASDGKTYTSKCEIRKVAKCEGVDVRAVSKGPCQGKWLPVQGCLGLVSRSVAAGARVSGVVSGSVAAGAMVSKVVSRKVAARCKGV